MGRFENVLIKYMSEVNLSVEDFRILDRYRGYLEIVKENRLGDGMAYMLLGKLFKKKELEIFNDVDNYIVNCLRRHVMNEYVFNKNKEM